MRRNSSGNAAVETQMRPLLPRSADTHCHCSRITQRDARCAAPLDSCEETREQEARTGLRKFRLDQIRCGVASSTPKLAMKEGNERFLCSCFFRQLQRAVSENRNNHWSLFRNKGNNHWSREKERKTRLPSYSRRDKTSASYSLEPSKAV